MAKDQSNMMIKGMDEKGQPITVEKEVWRKEVLPELLKEAWDDPNLLYGVITLAADNDMANDVIEAVKRAKELDPIFERGAAMCAVIHIRTGDYDQAEKVLNDYIKEHGKTSTILAALARVFGARGDDSRMNALLKEALSLDPNNESALSWYGKMAQDSGGNKGEEKVYTEVARLSGSWLAQCLLAHKSVEKKDKFEAVRLYEEALKNSNHGQAAVTMAGVDLASAGYVMEMINLLEKIYDPELHGLDAGFCLVKGYLETGQKTMGIITLNKLEETRPEMGEHIQELRQALAKLPGDRG